MKATGYILAVGATLGVVAAASARRPRRKKTTSQGTITTPLEIRALATNVENVVGQPGLGEFLSAVAYTETGGTFLLNARGSYTYGIFQMSEQTARLRELGLPRRVLFDLGWSIALATWNIARLRRFARPTQVIDWLAIRRGWAYPSLVADVNEDMPPVKGEEPGKRSAQVRERFELALSKTGIDQAFMYAPAFPPGYRWPGLEPVKEALGLQGATT